MYSPNIPLSSWRTTESRVLCCETIIHRIIQQWWKFSPLNSPLMLWSDDDIKSTCAAYYSTPGLVKYCIFISFQNLSESATYFCICSRMIAPLYNHQDSSGIHWAKSCSCLCVLFIDTGTGITNFLCKPVIGTWQRLHWNYICRYAYIVESLQSDSI